MTNGYQSEHLIKCEKGERKGDDCGIFFISLLSRNIIFMRQIFYGQNMATERPLQVKKLRLGPA